LEREEKGSHEEVEAREEELRNTRRREDLKGF
jgi:hypothetical protein